MFERWGANDEPDEGAGDGGRAAIELVPKDEIMETIPFFGFDACCNAVLQVNTANTWKLTKGPPSRCLRAKEVERRAFETAFNLPASKVTI